mgnify:CR=1 FL=1
MLDCVSGGFPHYGAMQSHSPDRRSPRSKSTSEDGVVGKVCTRVPNIQYDLSFASGLGGGTHQRKIHIEISYFILMRYFAAKCKLRKER